MILQIKYGADMTIAMKSVMGHEDLAFLISASVNKLAPDNVSEVDTAEVHAVLIGFSRLKPKDARVHKELHLVNKDCDK